MIDRLRARWPALRALLLIVFMVYMPLMAIPFPALSDADLSKGAGARAVSLVQTLLGPSDVAGARDRLRALYSDLGHVHAAAVKPIRPFYEILRSRQLWNMFQGASKMSFQLYIDARRAAPDDEPEWETLYTVHDPDATFERTRVEYRRVRAAYVAFSRGTPPPYRAFARWIARRALEDHPDIEEVRVRLRRLDYRPRAEREAQPERGVYSQAYRLTRETFERTRSGAR